MGSGVLASGACCLASALRLRAGSGVWASAGPGPRSGSGTGGDPQHQPVADWAAPRTRRATRGHAAMVLCGLAAKVVLMRLVPFQPALLYCASEIASKHLSVALCDVQADVPGGGFGISCLRLP
jgi:hypothetical protein